MRSTREWITNNRENPLKNRQHSYSPLLLSALASTLLFLSEPAIHAQFQITADQLAAATLVDPAALPKVGSFYRLKGRNPGRPMPPTPCFPGRLTGLGLPVYSLGGSRYLIDDGSVDYDALDQQLAAAQALATVADASLVQIATDSPQPMGQTSYPTGSLWLEITGMATNPPAANLVIHGTTNTASYEV